MSALNYRIQHGNNQVGLAAGFHIVISKLDKMQFNAIAITEIVGEGHWIMVHTKTFEHRGN